LRPRVVAGGLYENARNGCQTDEVLSVTSQAATPTPARPFQPAGSATWDDFQRLDLRVGRILRAEPFPEARKPAYRLVVDLGPGGTRISSAQLPGTYPDPAALVGRLVICVVNFPPRRIAGLDSELLVLGALPADGRIPLLSVDAGATPGDPIG
jgi:tRNA-binding protein